jgi:hypothetical protein
LIDENRSWCSLCEGSKRVIDLTESNKHFISKRIRDGNIDEAITISRIAWDNFPILKESAESEEEPSSEEGGDDSEEEPSSEEEQ